MSGKIDELIIFRNSQNIEARGTLLKFSKNQIVFETYNPFSIVQLSEILCNLKITRSNKNIYSGKAVVNNLINTGLLLIVSVTLVDDWLEDLGFDRFGDLSEEANKFVYGWSDSFSKIPDSYQLSVSKMRNFLSDANQWFKQIPQVNEIDCEGVIEKVKCPFIEKLSEFLLLVEDEARKIESSDVIGCKKLLQRELHPFLMRSPFVHRVFIKPLGYAGDYEMVNMMLRNPYEGEGLYAKLVNSFFLGAGPAEAHRNRIDILLERMTEVCKKIKNPKIFCFACGPAIEIQRFIKESVLSDNCEITLLDFSSDTLEYTSNILEKLKLEYNRTVKINYINKSANDVLRDAVKGNNNDFDGKFDFIYCAGLFDYLSDKICMKLLKLFYQNLSDDGLLLATNVHSDNPIKRIMEHIMEWYLIYRDNIGFENLLGKRIVNKKVYTDDTGLNVFLEARRDKDE